jgi:hypothetical protein
VGFVRSDQDIQRAARELGVSEEKLRRAIDNGELWQLAGELAQLGRGSDYVARCLGIPEEGLRGYMRHLAEERRQEEERRNAPPSWVENPPS